MDFLEAVKECDKGERICLERNGELIILYKSIACNGTEFLAQELEDGWCVFVPEMWALLSDRWNFFYNEED